MLVYCDTAVIIYCVEHVGALRRLASERLQELTNGGDQIAVSDLVRLECRVGPLRGNDLELLADYDSWFASPRIQRVPLVSAVFDRAAELRAQRRLRTVDAIHVAAAINASCGLFLTNDRRLGRCNEIDVEVLEATK